MLKNSKALVVFISVFLIGIVIGHFSTSIVLYKNNLKNPFDKEVITHRIFLNNLLDWGTISDENKVDVELILNNKVDEYISALELFRLEKQYIFEDYLNLLSDILPEDTYNNYLSAIEEHSIETESRYQKLINGALN